MEKTTIIAPAEQNTNVGSGGIDGLIVNASKDGAQTHMFDHFLLRMVVVAIDSRATIYVRQAPLVYHVPAVGA